MGPKNLCLAFMLLHVALVELPSTAHGASAPEDPPLAWYFNYANSIDWAMPTAFEKLVQGVTSWVMKAMSWWIKFRPYISRGYQNEPTTMETFRRWYLYLKAYLEIPVSDKNPWVRCAHASWPACTKRNGGVRLATLVWCPFCIYWECEYSYVIGRKPYDAPDPYVHVGGPPLLARRLLRAREAN